MAPAVAEQPETGVSQFLMIPVLELRPSPLNPRKRADTGKLEELASSMGNGVGVIEPLVVRRTDRPGYEIVAGERRWRAATLAGLDVVPAVVKPLTDAQVLEIMVIENDQREDINPLEEGDGFKRLMKFGFDIDKLAGRIGRSRKYIYDRVKLLDLVPAAKTLLLDGHISAGHAILLARLQPDQQKRAISLSRDSMGRIKGPLFEREDALFTPEGQVAARAAKKEDPYGGLKACSVRELEAWIDQHCRFDTGAPVSVELFPQTAHVVEDAKTVVFITYNHHVDPDAKDGNTQRIYSVVSWKRADGKEKSKSCARSVTGVFVVGPGRGEAMEVCVTKDCDVHWGKEKRAKARAATSPAAANKYATLRAADEARTAREQTERNERNALWDTATPTILAAIAEKVRSIPLKRVSAELLSRTDRESLKMATGLLPRPDRSAEHLLRLLLLEDLVAQHGRLWDRPQFGKRVKGLLQVDVPALLKKVQTSAKANAKSRTTLHGRSARTGEFTTVKQAKEHPSTHVVERMPKPGHGDTKAVPARHPKTTAAKTR